MAYLNFDIWSLLLILGIGQGVFLSIALLFRQPSSVALKLLGVLLVILTANLLEFLLLSSNYYVYLPHLMHSTHPFLFLLGPLFYFFILSNLRQDFRLKDISWLHLAPFCLSLLYFIPWFSSPGEFKLKVLAWSMTGEARGISLKGFLYAFAHILQTLVYTIAALYVLKTYQRIPTLSASSKSDGLVFLLRFNKIFIGYWVLQLLGLLAITFLQYYVYYIDYVLALLNAFFVQLLSFNLLFRSDTLSAFLINKKYQSSTLQSNTYHRILDRIKGLMLRDEIFLDGNLTLHKFSQIISVNKNYVSQVINQEFGCGFNDYVNHFRIEKAKALLANSDYSHLNLLGIALEVGFNNKTSFNRAFKRNTGLTPSAYRKSIQNNPRECRHN